MVLYVLKCYDSVNLCQVKTWRLLLQVHYYMIIAFSCLGKSVPIYFSNKNAKKTYFVYWQCQIPRGKLNSHMDKCKFHKLYFVKFKFHLEKCKFHKLYFLAPLQKKIRIFSRIFFVFFCIFNYLTWTPLWLVGAFQVYHHSDHTDFTRGRQMHGNQA